MARYYTRYQSKYIIQSLDRKPKQAIT